LRAFDHGGRGKMAAGRGNQDDRVMARSPANAGGRQRLTWVILVVGGSMEPAERVEREVRVRGEPCAVTARKVRGSWRASGELRGRVIEVLRAGTPDQAFEWWQNKASMQPLKD
jgi:hypothetical protein